MFELHYTGVGYPSKREIEADAKQRGFTHSYWATDWSYGYTGDYNGDTVVVYKNVDEMPDVYKHDALAYGKPIA